MVKFALKVDWMNLRVEISPNLKVVDTNTDKDKTIILLDSQATYSDDEYPVFVLSKEKVEEEEPFDDDDRFWKGFIAPSGSASEPSRPPTQESTQEKTVTMSMASNETDNPEKQKIQAQIDSIKKIVTKLDQQFNDGKIDQDTFIKKKNYLAQKMGNLMGKLEQL